MTLARERLSCQGEQMTEKKAQTQGAVLHSCGGDGPIHSFHCWGLQLVVECLFPPKPIVTETADISTVSNSLGFESTEIIPFMTHRSPGHCLTERQQRLRLSPLTAQSGGVGTAANPAKLTRWPDHLGAHLRCLRKCHSLLVTLES